MEEIKSHGQKAAGLIKVKGNQIDAYKKEGDWDNLLDDDRADDMIYSEGDALIGHCRMPTTGSEKIWQNNHPFIYKNLLLMHKGIIWNADELRKQYELKSPGETDSWVIVQIIDAYLKADYSIPEAINECHKELRGSWACCLMHRRHPDRVYLFTNDTDVEIAYLPDEEQYLFTTGKRDDLLKSITRVKTYNKIFKEYKVAKHAYFTLKDSHLVVLKEDPELYQLTEAQSYYGGRKWGKYNANKIEEKEKGRELLLLNA